MPKLEKLDLPEQTKGPFAPNYMFYCPGCKMQHGVWINPDKNDIGASWGWNGDLEKPTITPSILVTMGTDDPAIKLRCHSYVRNGMIEFLSDCTHELAGKTVEMHEV